MTTPSDVDRPPADAEHGEAEDIEQQHLAAVQVEVATPPPVRRWSAILARFGGPLPILVFAGLVTAIAINVGPALIGVRVLAGTDILLALSPWRDGGAFDRPHNWNLGDSIDAMFPSYITLHSRLWAGQLPLWNGLPGPGGLLTIGSYPTLTPVSWPWLVFPTSWAAGFVKLLQLLAAFFGMTLWMRQLRLPKVAAGVAGLLYVGSGFLSAWSNWSAQSTVACLAPALFWSLERLVRKRTLRAALAPPLIVAFLLFGNFPAVAGHAVYAAGAYFLIRLLAGKEWSGWRDRLRILGYGVGGLILGVAIAAVQVVPLLDKLSGTDLGYRANQFFGVQPFRSMLSLIYPQIMNQAGYPRSNPIEAYAFVGVTALMLCLVALVAGRHANLPRGVLAFLALGSLLAAALVWKQGWWTEWMADLPIFSANNSGRLRGIMDLLLCALAGTGVAVLVRFAALPSLRRRAIVIAGATAAVLVVAGTVVVIGRYEEKPSGLALTIDAVLAIAGAGVVVAALVVTAARWRTVVMATLVVVVAAGSIVSMNYFYTLSDRDTFYPDLAVVAAVQQEAGDDRMVSLGGFLGSSASAYELRSATGHVFYPPSWKELLVTLDPAAFTGPGTSPTNPVLHLDPATGIMRNPLLDRMSVSAVYLPTSRAIPGVMQTLDGQPIETNPGGTRSTAVTAAGIELPLARQPLRGIRFRVAETTAAGGSDLTVRAVVSDSETGEALASGLVTRPGFREGNLVDIPIALERLPAGDTALTLRLWTSTPDVAVDPVLDIATVRAPTPSIRVIGPAPDGIRLTYADAHGSVWSRPSALPRVRWASSTMVYGDTAQRLTAMVDPATPTDTVLLSSPAPPADGLPADVTVVRDDGENVRAVVQAQGAGYLVLADGVQSNFQATVDGAVATLYDADNAFGAVHVPAGRHVIEIRYAPSGLRYGLLVSGIAVVVWLALLVGTWLVARGSHRSSTAPGRDDRPLGRHWSNEPDARTEQIPTIT